MLNHIDVMGRLTADPELRTTQSGVSVASFTLAVERDFKSGAEKETDFISCVAWRQTAEFVTKYFHKGGMIAVSGRLQSRKWEDRDGGKRTAWEIMAENCYFCGANRSDSNRDELIRSGGGITVHGGESAFTDLDDDDGVLPF